MQAYLQAVGLNPPDGLSSLLSAAGGGEGADRTTADAGQRWISNCNLAHPAFLYKDNHGEPAFFVPRQNADTWTPVVPRFRHFISAALPIGISICA
jgi:hypothetical protein